MRTLRLSLAWMVTLTLIAGLAAIAAAQEEPAPVTFVTGTVVEAYSPDDGEGESDLASHDLRGYEVMTQSAPIHEVVEWSDPRLPTDLWLVLGYTLISTGVDERESVGAMNIAWQGLLEDEQGRWHVTGRSVQGNDEKYSLYVLTGEGAYEGLSALLRGTAPDDAEAALLHAHAPWDMGYEGYIFEAELTPFPDEPVRDATEAYQLWPVQTGPPDE